MEAVSAEYGLRSNSDRCLTGDLPQMLPGVIAYGIQFDLNLYCIISTGWCETFIENLPALPRMDDGEAALGKLSQEKATYSLVLKGKKHALENVSLSRIENPVRGPTARGNVYVETHQSYRISASVDPRLSQTLSGTMLGPSSEFGGLHIIAESQSVKIKITGSLLSMARSGGVARLQIAVAEIQ